MSSREQPSPYHGASENEPKVFHRATDDTCSDLSGQGPYQVIEYDLHNDGSATNPLHTTITTTPDALLENLTHNPAALQIDDDSPAAQALAANANIKVSSLGKAARAVHMQTVRKIVKRATGTTKSGLTRGKPPRLPPIAGEGEKESGSEDSEGVVEEEGTEVPIATLDRIEETEEEEGAEQDVQHVMHGDEQPQPPQMITPAAAAAMSTENTTSDVHEHSIPEGVVPGTAEAGKRVLDQVDTHDLLKLLRWRRKGKEENKVKKPKSYVKGKVIDGEHELYTLSIAVMIGVRTSISRTNTELNSGPGNRWVKPLDFRATEKYEFRPKGGSMTPPHMLAHTFKFKDYAPVVFAYLRRMYGVNEFDFLLSVCGNANFIEFISNAKSGQFFFYSNDGRYMIKTMTNAESKFLRRILPDYFRHCSEHPNTMITRFFGMYRVKLYHLRRNVKFVIMNSVYHTDKYLQTFYDLKGSVVGRNAKRGQAVKKDNDMRRSLPEGSLALPPTQRSKIRVQIQADCNFLTRMGIMDYSMLVGVHHVPYSDDRKASIATQGFRPRANSASSRSEMDGDHSHSENSDDPLHFMHRKSPSVDSKASLSDSRRLSESIGAFFYDNGLEEDDCSYLDGTGGRQHSDERAFSMETERKKQATIEKLYWPFHRFYDIHGHRRVKPATCVKCSNKPCSCPDDEHLLTGYAIPRFIPPLSSRKDKGLELDTSNQKLPMKLKGPHGEEQLFEGKIFYMGIIDVLQEYNSRKALESTYRMMRVNRMEASCVAPAEYSTRFVNFFDEYTQPLPRTINEKDGGKQKGVSTEFRRANGTPKIGWQRN